MQTDEPVGGGMPMPMAHDGMLRRGGAADDGMADDGGAMADGGDGYLLSGGQGAALQAEQSTGNR